MNEAAAEYHTSFPSRHALCMKHTHTHTHKHTYIYVDINTRAYTAQNFVGLEKKKYELHSFTTVTFPQHVNLLRETSRANVAQRP